MSYSELIKSFDRIRSYMREFYVYGFKSCEEYDSKSARTYDNERRRIESCLGDYMSFHQDASGKNVFRVFAVCAFVISNTVFVQKNHGKSCELMRKDEFGNLSG